MVNLLTYISILKLISDRYELKNRNNSVTNLVNLKLEIQALALLQ